ncbi:MAG: hypothetical protein ACRDZU_16155, partial [Acidimicrobiales bacterium]
LDDAVDVSAGYAFAAINDATGRGVVTAGAPSPMSAPVFSNGGEVPGEVTVTVRAGSPSGPVIHNEVIEMGSYQRQDVEFSYTPATEGPYTLYTTVGAEGDDEPNNTQATAGWAGPAEPTVLVVDDEGYTDGEDAYTGALAALGVPYAVATTHVSAKTMETYEAVIWVAAIDRGAGQLDADDREAIASYLDGGGRLWLASNRAAGAAEVEEDDAFINGYFGAATEETTTLEHPHVATGTGVVFPDDLSFELQPYPIRPFSDIIVIPDSGTFGTPELALVLTEANKPGRDGKGFGTRVEGDDEHGSFRTVLTPFSLGQASSADTWVAVTRAVLHDFGVTTNQYSPDVAEPLVLHPVVRFQVSGRDTPVSAVVLGGDEGGPVTLFYRVYGTEAFAELAMAPGEEPGTFGGVIPGESVTASGLEYYLKVGANSVYDPPAAASGELTHAIAVAIPEVAAPPVPVPAPAAAPTPPGRIPATGGEALAGLAALLLLAGLAVRRFHAH